MKRIAGQWIDRWSWCNPVAGSPHRWLCSQWCGVRSLSSFWSSPSVMSKCQASDWETTSRPICKSQGRLNQDWQEWFPYVLLLKWTVYHKATEMVHLHCLMSVYCERLIYQVWSASSISVLYIQLFIKISPWYTLSCSWNIKQPRTINFPNIQAAIAFWLTRKRGEVMGTLLQDWQNVDHSTFWVLRRLPEIGKYFDGD